MSSRPEGNDFRRRPQLTDADMGADGTSQKARHEGRAEDGGGCSRPSVYRTT
jgi:hypothetical protein